MRKSKLIKTKDTPAVGDNIFLRGNLIFYDRPQIKWNLTYFDINQTGFKVMNREIFKIKDIKTI